MLIWQPFCWTLFKLSPFDSLHPKNTGIDTKSIVPSPLEPKLCEKYEFDNPDCRIWQPCLLDTLQNATIQFLAPKNMGIDTKSIVLSPLEPKLWAKNMNLATLLIESGNPVCWTLF